MSIWSTKMISCVSDAVHNAFWQVLFLFSPSSFRLKYCIQDWRWNLCRSAPHLRIIQQLSLSLQSNEQDGEALSINHQNKHTFQASTILIARVNYMDTKDFALEWVSPTLLDQSSLITFFQTRLSAEVKIYTYIYIHVLNSVLCKQGDQKMPLNQPCSCANLICLRSKELC